MGPQLVVRRLDLILPKRADGAGAGRGIEVLAGRGEGMGQGGNDQFLKLVPRRRCIELVRDKPREFRLSKACKSWRGVSA